MLPDELAGIQYFAPESALPFQANVSMIHHMRNSIPANNFHLNGSSLTNNFHNTPFTNPVHEFSTYSTSLSSNSTSDEADEHQQGVIDERKQRRMISNRESARRSRMRKQKHLDELWSQVMRLRNENRNLIEKLNQVSECYDRVVDENARLKEENSDLHRMLTNMQIGSPYTATAFIDHEEVPCTTAHLRAESSSKSVTISIDLLH